MAFYCMKTMSIQRLIAATLSWKFRGKRYDDEVRDIRNSNIGFNGMLTPLCKDRLVQAMEVQMGIRYHVRGALIVSAVLLAAGANASAQDRLATANAPEAATLQPASPLAPAPGSSNITLPATIRTVSLTPADSAPVHDLHTDPRWPQIANCVNNTATPEAFQTCLQSALLADTTGNAAALLHH
jgi:hypothetical protein